MQSFADLYCERLEPGLWGEPLNALTNLAFVVAAWAARGASLRARSAGKDSAVLPALIGLIGVASALFHTTATTWAGALDSGFIALYMLVFVVVFAQQVGQVPRRWAWLAAPTFAGFAALVTISINAWAASGWRGTGLYLAAWLGLCALAAWAAFRGSSAWRPIAAAAMVFAISLSLRQLDQPLCDVWPWGTHFAWHVLNAVTLWLSVRAVLHVRPPASQALP